MSSWELANPFVDPDELDEPSIDTRGHIYTVSELGAQIKGVFQNLFSDSVWVEGELTEPKIYPSGHLWFSLKDADSSMRCVMWANSVERLKFDPEHGLKVIVSGKVDYYTKRGDVRFQATVMEPKGIGALQLAFEQLKEKFQKEGLFDEDRKRPIPTLPERIGIVTAPNGAAIDDMLRVLRGNAHIVLCPSRVQGETAAESIAQSIAVLNEQEDLDLLIVGRGGGSLEDLWAFNEEPVARAIVASRIPVISAVGHEKDVSIADLVADMRVATPTKAAEIAVAQRREALDRFERVLETEALAEPESWLGELEEKLQELETELVTLLEDPLVEGAQSVRVFKSALMACSPQAVILHKAGELSALRSALNTTLPADLVRLSGSVRELKQGLHQEMGHALDQATSEFLRLTSQLQALSPLAVLNRGYSITFDGQEKIIKDASRVKPGEVIATRLHQGTIESRVERVEK